MFLIKNRAIRQAVRNSRNLFKNDT